MKTISSLVLVCLLVTSAAAQTEESYYRSPEKIFFGISVGPSFPQSDFSNGEVTPSSGYAKTGFRFETYAGINLFGVIGLCATGFLNENGTDPEKLRNSLSADYPGTTWQIDSKVWRLFGGLGGIDIEYPYDHTTVFHIRLMGGFLSAESPEFRFTSGSYEYLIDSKTASGFAYATLLGANYYLDRNVSLTLDFEFLSSKPNFDNVRTTEIIDGITTESVTSYSRLMRMFNIALGIAYSFR